MVKGSGLTLLSPGQYRYPFQFKLPAKNLPASYEGKYGYVRYYIEARIDRTWKSEHFIIQGFSIQGSPVNLNKKADIRTPILVGKEVEVAQGCISLSHIQVKVETNRSGYVPGETLQFTAYVNNKSRHRIKKFRAVFVQFTSYYGHRRDSSKKICLREQTSELIVIKGKGFKAEVTKQIEGEFEIPPLPATGSHTFPYINIEYYLQFTVKVANFDKTVIDVIVPVLIGNIPSSQVYTWKEPQSNLVSLYQPLLTFDSGDATEASPMGVPQPIEKECIPPIRVRKPDDDDDIKEVIVDLKGRYKPKYRCYIEKCDVKPKMKVFQVGEDSVRFFFMKYMPYKVAKVAVHNAIEKSK
ncbi:arrestin domain-containing protein 1-like [Saccoglossus kowalevskii]